MSGDIGLIKQALGEEPSDNIHIIVDELEKKKALREFWSSKTGKMVLQDLQDDCVGCLMKLEAFEKLTFDEVKSFLSKYRANIILLSTLKQTTTIEEVQDMLDREVKAQSERLGL